MAETEPLADAPTNVLVFAYGSNLCRERLIARVGPIETVAVARLDTHRLCFHKRGRDGSGKADAFFTGDRADRIWGVVYDMTESAKRELDRIEGVGCGYVDAQADLTSAGGERLRAWLYLAQPAWIDASLAPAPWYRALIVTGAREHGLPAGYVAELETRSGSCGASGR